MFIQIAQIVLAGLLIITVLLQQRGSGLGSTFGGEGNAYSTRRGAERVIFISTIVIGVLFFAVSILRIIY